MPRRFSDRPVTPATTLNDETMNSLIVPLDRAIEALEGQVIDWQEQVDLFNSLGLKRISEAVQPLLDQINGAISGGLLVANTVDTVGFAEGDEIDLLITEQSRVTFQPTPFVMLTHASEINDWALCRVTNYVAQTGVISLEVLTLNGSGASRTGWIISASAGLASAILAASTSAQVYADAAQQAAEDANAAAILIAGGPVSSVNGRAGVVTGLAEAADVAAALAGKADASAMASALAAKADQANTYTKAQVDGAIATAAPTYATIFKYS